MCYEIWVSGLRDRIQKKRNRFWGFGFPEFDVGIRVSGVGFGVSGCRDRVSGFGTDRVQKKRNRVRAVKARGKMQRRPPCSNHHPLQLALYQGILNLYHGPGFSIGL